jgi:hypothetical protein
MVPFGNKSRVSPRSVGEKVPTDQHRSSTLSINHNWANASCIIGMYEALADQVDKSIQLLSDIRPPPSAPAHEMAEFYELVYNNLCRPSWGWSFQDFWDVVGWMVRHPKGDHKWRLDPTASMSLEDDRGSKLVAQLTVRWLQREEAPFLRALSKSIHGTASYIGMPQMQI